MTEQRHLAAILVADVVGYSRAMRHQPGSMASMRIAAAANGLAGNLDEARRVMTEIC